MRLDGALIRCPAQFRDLADAAHSGVLWRASDGRFLVQVPGVARYLVGDGKAIDIDPCDAADPHELERFLRMTPAAALYLQRAVPVLHAAVAMDPAGRAVVLAGYSGAGKSELLDALVQRGWGLLTDDLAPVTLDDDGVPVAIPMWPDVRLWPDSVERVAAAGSNAGGARLREFGRSGLRNAADWSSRLANAPRPIGAIWWLVVHGFDRIDVRNIESLSRFEAIGAMAYNKRIAHALLDRPSYLRVAGTMAGSDIPIRRLARPFDRWTADELADIVENAITN